MHDSEIFNPSYEFAAQNDSLIFLNIFKHFIILFMNFYEKNEKKKGIKVLNTSLLKEKKGKKRLTIKKKRKNLRVKQ